MFLYTKARQFVLHFSKQKPDTLFCTVFMIFVNCHLFTNTLRYMTLLCKKRHIPRKNMTICVKFLYTRILTVCVTRVFTGLF